MKHMITWSEIPVKDMQRAMNFYREALNINFKQDKMNGFDYAMFDSGENTGSGALVAGEGYTPGTKGTTVYFDAGDDLSLPLDRISKMGNKIVVQKTAIHEGSDGYYAQFIDSEGNRVGLYSSN